MGKIFLQALRREETARPPVWMMRQAGRYLPEYQKVRKEAGDFMTLALTPEMAAEVTLQPIRRFQMDAAILFSDILMIPHGLGQKVWFEAGEGPKLEALKDIGAIRGLNMNTLHDRLAPVYEAVRLIKKDLPQQTSLIGFCGAPWTVACYMLEGGGSKNFTDARRWAYQQPLEMEYLLQTLVSASAAYLCAQIEAGAEAVQIFDSWAGLVPPALIDRLVVRPTLAIAAQVKAVYPHVPIIVFARGVRPDVLRQYTQDGKGLVDALGLDETQDLHWAHKHVQPHMAIQGNLDNALLLTEPATVTRAVQDMLHTAALKPGYVVNLGHGILPHTPIENVTAYVEAVHNYGKEAAA